MKKFFLLALAALLIFSATNLSAQKADKYTQAITANPIGLIFGYFNASYEFQVAPENTLTINGLYWGYSGWSAFGIGGSYRWYIVKEDKKKIIEGFGFGPTASLGFWNYENDGYSGGTSLSIGGVASYKWVFGGFVVEPLLVLSFNLMTIEGLAYNSFGLGCNLGYAW
jgi:hypothetical protein